MFVDKGGGLNKGENIKSLLQCVWGRMGWALGWKRMIWQEVDKIKVNCSAYELRQVF